MSTSSLFVKNLKTAASELDFTIPHLFSIKPITTELLPKPGQRREASKLVVELNFISQIFDMLLDMEVKNLKLNDGSATTLLGMIEETRRFLKHTLPTEQAFLWSRYIEFIHAYIHGICFNTSNFLAKFCTKEIPEDSLLYWFKLAANFILIKISGEFSNAGIETLIELCSHITNASLKEGALKIILAVLVQYKPRDYLNSTSLTRLMELLKDDSGLPYVVSIYAQKRFDFVFANLIVNSVYFQNLNSPILGEVYPKLSLSLTFDLSKETNIIDKKLKFELDLTSLRLLRWVSHFNEISFPIVEFNFKGVSEEVGRRFNLEMIRELQRLGFLSSGRMLIKSKVFKLVEGKLVFSEEFHTVLKDLIRRYSGIKAEKALQEFLDEFIKGYQHQMNLRKRLATFVPIDALALFYLMMSHDVPVGRVRADDEVLAHRPAITRLVGDCLGLAREAKEVNESARSDPAKHEAWFRLSTNVIAKLWADPRDLIVQVGTPIRLDKEESSAHAFYVTFKFHAVTRQFQIMISNGGPGLKFHKRDSDLAESEYADPEYGYYRPVVSTLLDMNDENREFLMHYLYRLIILAYTPNVEGLMANIYFKSAAFQGFTHYTTAHVKEAETTLVYAAQLSENCTIRNFKKALQLSLGISEDCYYRLEVLFLQLIDNWLSHALPTAVVAPAASGGGSSSGSGSLIDLEEEAGSVLVVTRDKALALRGIFFAPLIIEMKPDLPLPYCGTKLDW